MYDQPGGSNPTLMQLNNKFCTQCYEVSAIHIVGYDSAVITNIAIHTQN